MAKTIQLTDAGTGKTYVLEYDRASVVYAESIGFSPRKAADAPMTATMTLFRAAFHKNHPRVQDDEIDRLFDAVPDKDGLYSVLGEMLQETYGTLEVSEDGEDRGNVTWKALA